MTAVANNSTSILGLMQVVNTILAEGYLGIIIMIIVFAACFFNLMFTTNDIRRALMPSTIITFVVALMLRAGDLIPDIALYVALVSMAVTVSIGWINTY